MASFYWLSFNNNYRFLMSTKEQIAKWVDTQKKNQKKQVKSKLLPAIPNRQKDNEGRR